MKQPTVTAIVSTYNAERFIRGCLDDLVAQTVFSDIEVLVIDSGSTQNESAICQEYAQHYPQIKVIRTEREPLYVAWNRAIPMARGKYLTNANTDDRHRQDYMEVMIQALETNPDVGLVYAEQYISYTENESFEECKLQNAKIYRVPDYKPEELMLRCITGSQPMWRKSLHDKIGYFNTSYTIAADYDMWLRIANISNLLHVHGPLGVVFYSPTTISGAENTRQLNLEVLAIQRCFICQAKWRNLPGIRKQVAAELFGRGYQRIKHENDNRAAEPFIREAIKLDPTNISYLKTYLIRCIPYIMN